MDYNSIAAKMNETDWYSAASLNVSGASMTAMVKRGMVEKKVGKPNLYRKLPMPISVTIAKVMREKNRDFAIIWRANEHLGMYCTEKNGIFYDAWNKIYDISNAVKYEVGGIIYER